MQEVILKVYDVLGNEVATLVNEELSAGEYEVEFNTSCLKHLTIVRNLFLHFTYRRIYSIKEDGIIEIITQLYSSFSLEPRYSGLYNLSILYLF